MPHRQMSDKGKKLGEKANQTQQGERGPFLNMKSRGWSSISQSGANSCQSVDAISLGGQQQEDRIQMEMEWADMIAVQVEGKNME